ncbi:MAG: hypothetical protein AAGK98_18745 [Pseudomonadota bacterium]
MRSLEDVQTKCIELAEALKKNMEAKQAAYVRTFTDPSKAARCPLLLPDLELTREALLWIDEWKHRGALVKPIIDAWGRGEEEMRSYCENGVDWRTGSFDLPLSRWLEMSPEPRPKPRLTLIKGGS